MEGADKRAAHRSATGARKHIIKEQQGQRISECYLSVTAQPQITSCCVRRVQRSRVFTTCFNCHNVACVWAWGFICCTQLFPLLSGKQKSLLESAAALPLNQGCSRTQKYAGLHITVQMVTCCEEFSANTCMWFSWLNTIVQVCWPLWTAPMWNGAPGCKTSSPTPKSSLSSLSSSRAWWRSDKVLIFSIHVLRVMLQNHDYCFWPQCECVTFPRHDCSNTCAGFQVKRRTLKECSRAPLRIPVA